MAWDVIQSIKNAYYTALEDLEGKMIKNPEDLQTVRENMAETLRLLSRRSVSEQEILLLVAGLLKKAPLNPLEISSEKVKTARIIHENVSQMLNTICEEHPNPDIERNIAKTIVSHINTQDNMNEVLKTLWLYTRRTDQLRALLEKSTPFKKDKKILNKPDLHVPYIQNPWILPLGKFEENFMIALDRLLGTETMKHEKPFHYFKRQIDPTYVIPKFPKEAFENSARVPVDITPKAAPKITSSLTNSAPKLPQGPSMEEIADLKNSLQKQQDTLKENLALFDDMRAEGTYLLKEKNDLLSHHPDNTTYKHLETHEDVIGLMHCTHVRKETEALLETIKMLLNPENTPTGEDLTRTLNQSEHLNEKLFHRAEQIEEALMTLQTEVVILSAPTQREDMDYIL